jgi:hypothetical protein
MAPHPVVNFLGLWWALDQNAEDRTIAICCGAYLEDILAQAIVTKLPGAKGELLKRLVEERGPLGSARARIDMACALGLMDNDDRLICIAAAHIRNQFAHNIAVASFDHLKVAQILDKLQLQGPNRTEYEELYPATAKQTRRQRFFCLVTMVGVRLANYVNSIHGTGKFYRIKTNADDDLHKLDVIHTPGSQ